MIKREEVEDLLLICDQRPVLMPSRVSVDSDTLAELARTWLRVNDAPVGVWSELTETDGVITSAHLSNRLPFHTLAEGQRVRLVPEADSGGEG